MKNTSVFRFWKDWGLVSRLMLAVGIAIVIGGGVQTVLLVAESAAEHSARLLREQRETLVFLAPLVADQALDGDYAAISQLLKNQVEKGEIDRFAWTDRDGKTLIAQDAPDQLDAPAWFARLAVIEHGEQSLDVTAGGVGYGKLSAWMTPVKAHNRLWLQFVKQLQILAVTLFLMLQFIWLIFRGNLGTLHMLAEVAAEYQPDELQHQEQRHRQDLQLLDELQPKPVVGLDRSHPGTELSVSHAARRDVETLFPVLNDGKAREPSRCVELIRRVLRDQRLAVLVGPREPVDLAFLDLVFQQLADRRVVTDERLIGNQRREEDQRFPLLAQQPGGMLARALCHEQDG